MSRSDLGNDPNLLNWVKTLNPRAIDIDGSVKNCVDNCEGCERIIESSIGRVCGAYPAPEKKWANGICNFATHINFEIKTEVSKINPSKTKNKRRNEIQSSTTRTVYFADNDYIPSIVMQNELLKRRIRYYNALSMPSTLSNNISFLFDYNFNRCNWSLTFESKGNASLVDYANFFIAINNIYNFLLTLIRSEYFISYWLSTEYTDLLESDIIEVCSITRNSPNNIRGEALGEGLKALAEVLNIGKQYQEIRISHIKIKGAELDLKRKTAEFEREERKAALSESAYHEEMLLKLENMRIDLESKRLNLEKERLLVKTMELDNANKRIECIGKKIQIVDKLPDELKVELKDTLATLLSVFHSSKFEISQISVDN